MSTVIRGRRPDTGAEVEITFDATITAIEERPGPPAEDTPHLAPGFVDLQVNGYAGLDVNGPEASVERLQKITDALARIGVTTWAPTLITASEAAITRGLSLIAEARASSPRLARAIPFAHVEGPFLSAHDGPRGVHDAAHIRDLDAAEVERWMAHGPVGILTVSPHTPDAPDHIARIVELGVLVAIGHTHASVAQITAAVDAGATLSTHLGNGIHPMLARHPNPIWTQLAEDRLSCGLIADGHHLPAETLEVMLRAKGTAGAFLVSDSTELAGLPPGRYETAVGGAVELSAEGRLSPVGSDLLAGAARDVSAGLRFVLASTSLALPEALELVTTNPARILGRERLLEVGAPADLLQVDHEGRVGAVWQAGERIAGT